MALRIKLFILKFTFQVYISKLSDILIADCCFQFEILNI